MGICIFCRQDVDQCRCFDAANDDHSFSPNFIPIPEAKLLGRPSTVNRLAIAYRARELPRREIVGFIGDQIAAFWEADGVVVESDVRIDLMKIDLEEIFNTEQDWSHRWLGRFLAFGVMPPLQQAQNRVLGRLAMLWLALAIKHRPQAEIVLW